jgi:hypothetical protein
MEKMSKRSGPVPHRSRSARRLDPHPPFPLLSCLPVRDLSVQRYRSFPDQDLNGVSFFFSQMASDSKVLFWNGKIPSKSIHFDAVTDKDRAEQPAPAPTTVPTLCGMPLKYISYVLPFLSPLTFLRCGRRLQTKQL